MITLAGITAFSTVIALVVPVIILAILVDSSRDAQQLGSTAHTSGPDKTSIRQSRRTLLSIAVGAILEFYSLIAILTGTGAPGQITPVDYAFPILEAGGLLILLYILFIPHVELHISNIRNDPSTARWTLIVGWSSDIAILIAAAVNLIAGGSQVNHYAGYVLLVFGLLLSGSMLTLTIMILRQKPPDTPSVESQPG